MHRTLSFLKQRLEVDRNGVLVLSQLHAYPVVPKAFLYVVMIYLCLEADVLLHNNKRRSADNRLLVVCLQNNVAVERDAK